MKNIYNSLKFILTFLLVFMFGCETVDLNQLERKNQVTIDLAEPTYVFNYIQIALPEFVDSANDFTQQVTRQMAMTGGKTYENAFAPVNSNVNWSTAYEILTAIKLMEPKATQRKQTQILGASKIIRAYVMLTLVDLYGDVPYSEAFLGNENLNPKYDKSADVYKKALLELDQALLLLDETLNPVVEDLENPILDLYYGTGIDKKFQPSKWKTLARTLKFRAYVTARKAGAELGVNISSELATLMSQDIIDTASEDFVFKYSTSQDPLSRHPLFSQSYQSNVTPPYISNYMLWTMVREKPTSSTNPAQADNNLVDPRTKYYFYNQVGNADSSDSFDLPCKTSSRPDQYNFSEYASFYRPNRFTPFCTTKTSSTLNSTPYWGADHGYAVGRPQDGAKVTIVGLYPAGGKFGGGSSPQTVNASAGEKGAGIMPILLSSYVRFLKAEAYHTVFSDPASARIEMDLAINASIDKASTLFSGYALPTTTERTLYFSFVDTNYDNNPNKQLEIIMKEFFIASWGNGIETYNNYRRTGFPSNLQPTLEPYPGDFFSTALYPSNSITNNQNAPQNIRTKKTFWDVNSPILH